MDNPDILESQGKGQLTVAMVKKLREETGASIMTCKRALIAVGLDYVAAKRLLTSPDKPERP